MFRGYLIYLSYCTEKTTALSFVMIFNLKALPGFCTIFWQIVSSFAGNLWNKCLLRVIWKVHRRISVCLNLRFNDFSCSTPYSSQSSVPWQFWSLGAWVADLQSACVFAATRNLLSKYSWLISYLWRVVFGVFWRQKNYFSWCLRRKEGLLVCKYYQGKPAVFSQITVNVLGFSG